MSTANGKQMTNSSKQVHKIISRAKLCKERLLLFHTFKNYPTATWLVISAIKSLTTWITWIRWQFLYSATCPIIPANVPRTITCWMLKWTTTKPRSGLLLNEHRHNPFNNCIQWVTTTACNFIQVLLQCYVLTLPTLLFFKMKWPFR